MKQKNFIENGIDPIYYGNFTEDKEQRKYCMVVGPILSWGIT